MEALGPQVEARLGEGEGEAAALRLLRRSHLRLQEPCGQSGGISAREGAEEAMKSQRLYSNLTSLLDFIYIYIYFVL